MRALRALCCAVAITACLAPGVRGDEYTKQTFLTFSGPVQLPGVTLPAGTYMFKLADPSSGRRVLQVWDEEGTKLYTTLLTIPDQRMEASTEPVVMFDERPSGEPQAIRAWFYPGDRMGMEFVYPKNQAMKIAVATHDRVLSFDDDEPREDTAMHTAKVGRIDATGQLAEQQAATADTAQSASTTTSDTSTAPDTAADRAAAPGNGQAQPSASAAVQQRTGAAAAAEERAGDQAAASGANERVSRPSDTQAGASRSAAVNAPAQPQAGRDADRPIGTSGTAAQQPGSTGAPSTGTAERRELPRTAGSMALVQMLSGLSVIAAFAVRRLRRRHA